MNHELMDKQVLVFVDMLPFHKQLRLKRQFDGLTQADLGRKLNCATSTINETEAGKKTLPYKSLDKARNYLYNEFYIDGELQTGEEEYYG